MGRPAYRPRGFPACGSREPPRMFDGFSLDMVDVGEATLRVRHGGAGPAVLLLHGHPRTHTTWHRVAPLLARTHTVVCPDLRGYGQSSKPPTKADHEQASKRAMARDAVRLMGALGHERFAVVGHDRGAYAALRTALDHPGAVERLAVLDAVPIVEALERCDARFASLVVALVLPRAARRSRPSVSSAPIPRPGTARRPSRWGQKLRRLPRGDQRSRDGARDVRGLPRGARHRPCARRGRSRRRQARDVPDAHALVGARRHGAAVRRSARDLAILGRRLRGGSIDSGHHMAEEAPDELAARLLQFLP